MNAIALIPARLESSRLPRKMLADLGGKPLIVRTLEAVRRASCFDEVIVVTDSTEILEAVQDHGGSAVLSSPHHCSGSDRLAEALQSLSLSNRYDVVVNVQGDEPLVPAAALDSLVALFQDPAVQVASACCPWPENESAHNPDRVKVVLDAQDLALYFSRAAIPVQRLDSDRPAERFLHAGLYAYRPARLLEFTRLQPAPSEESEKLEQLRFLHHGIPIRMLRLLEPLPSGVDNPDDLERVRAFYGSPNSLR
jgi:3-deoxy-manno-octulosonate cytidylyltransferase (CMP-KDO synthetase)